MTRAILIGVAVAIVGAYVYYSRAEIARLRASESLSRQNLSALSDTLRTVVNEKGEVEHSRLILVQERDELERTNSGLAARINRLSGELEVAIAASAEAESNDTTEVVVIQNDSTWTWTYDPVLPAGNRLLVEGRSGMIADSAWTEVTRHLVQIDLVVAIRERGDGLREAVATSTWPGLTLDVEGAILEPKLVMPPRKRSWTLPAAVGFAVGVVLWEAVR